MIEINLLTSRDEQKWQKFIQNSKDSTIYHTLEWKQVLEETYNYKPYYFIAKENNKIQGILPSFQIKSFITGNRLVSLPFSYLGGPIATSDEVMEKLINTAKNKTNELNCKYLELRVRDEMPELGLFKSDYYIDFSLELSSTEYTWKKLHDSTRRATKKAMRSGVEIVTANMIDDIRIFHKLEIKTRKKHGLPVRPLRFFEGIWQGMNPNLARLLLAKFNDEVIAGIILFTFKDTVTYTYGVSDEKYLSYRPNNLLLWNAIEFGCNNGYDHLDLGRTSPDERGLVDFKRRWGARGYILPYYYYPEIPNLTSSNRTDRRYRLLTGFWRKMPSSISKTLGPMVLKRLG